MFRSAAGAVLAIALSSSIASAQTFVPEAQALAGLGGALAQPEPIEKNLIITFDVAELAPPLPMDAANLDDASDIAGLEMPALIETNLIVSFDFAELTLSVPMDAAALDDASGIDDFPMPALIDINLIVSFDFAELAPAVPTESADVDRGFDVGPLAPATDFSVVVRGEIRPASLRPMYAAQIALQAADLITTVRALNAGHRELNPLFKSGNRSAMVLAKVASASLDILVAERMWRKNPKGAVLVMIVSNVMMLTIVANNLGTLSAGSR